MAKWRIVYREHFSPSPLTFWVHRGDGAPTWHRCRAYDPPLPKAIPLKGHPLLIVELFGVALCFASVAEIEHFVDTISQKHLPTSTQLSAKRGSQMGPNSHWLSRLPAKLKPWSKRVRMIPTLKTALHEFKKLEATG